VLFPPGDYDAYRIDVSMNIPEVNRKNNTIRREGSFRHIEKLRLQLLASIDNPERTQLFFTPVIAWNKYDGTWAGLAFYNSVLPSKPLSFAIAPSYAFGSNKIVGGAEFNFAMFPKSSFIHRMDINSSIKSYSWADESYFGGEGDADYRFTKLTQQIQLTLNKKFARSSANQHLDFRNIFLTQESPNPSSYYTKLHRQFFNLLSYSYDNVRIINPFHFSVTAETGSRQENDFYLKTYLQGNYRINYPRKRAGIDLRCLQA
jgi:hypothetical protein